MCEYETEQHIQQRNKRTQRDEEMCYWGYKFEQYVTSGTVNMKIHVAISTEMD